MADNMYIVRCDTRRELRAVIASEADSYRDAGFIGCNQRAISHIAAIAWRNRRKVQLPYALPLAPPHARDSYCHGIFVASASRDEYREHVESDQW